MIRRKLIVIFLLTCYFLMTFNYLSPLIAHHVNIEYIVEYLCEQREEEVNHCMGSCQLNKTIMDELTKTESDNNKKSALITINRISPHYTNDCDYLKKPFLKQESYQTESSSLMFFYTKPQTPPPKIYS